MTFLGLRKTPRYQPYAAPSASHADPAILAGELKCNQM